MAMKRKRSWDGSSSVPSNSSPIKSDIPWPGEYGQLEGIPRSWLSPRSTTDTNCPDASGRTMKRWRNDRPDEGEVCRRTVKTLFDAQRTLDLHDTASDSLALDNVPTTTQNRQQSLHAFWQLPKSDVPETCACHIQATLSPSMACQDCDRKMDFSGPDAMNIDMSTSAMSVVDEDMQCTTCHRIVCDLCAIRGQYRTCLSCVR